MVRSFSSTQRQTIIWASQPQCKAKVMWHIHEARRRQQTRGPRQVACMGRTLHRRQELGRVCQWEMTDVEMRRAVTRVEFGLVRPL
jgi:hypothetical protein